MSQHQGQHLNRLKNWAWLWLPVLWVTNFGDGIILIGATWSQLIVLLSADSASKGISLRELVVHKLWLEIYLIKLYADAVDSSLFNLLRLFEFVFEIIFKVS